MIANALHPFGIAVRGVEIGNADAAQADVLGALVCAHRVLVLRDQHADDAALVGFLGLLGELTFTAGEIPVDGAPQLNLVSNVGRTTPPRSVFHTDTSYVDRPPAFTALRAVALPGSGGATLFSDQVAAAARLPMQCRDALANRTLLHRSTGVADCTAGTRQPVLRRHPVTGDVALYLSTPERCSALSGVDACTSRRVVAALYRHSIRASGLYGHAWADGDIVIWDNRTTMHRADHSDVAGDRVLHRGMVMGEGPIFA